MSPLPGDGLWHVSSHGGHAGLLATGEPLYHVYRLFVLQLLLRSARASRAGSKRLQQQNPPSLCLAQHLASRLASSFFSNLLI